MSTARTIQMALTGAKSAYDTLSDFSDRKAEQAYSSLSDAATAYGPRADAAVERAGQATQAARGRLEKSFDQIGQEGAKLSARGQKQAQQLEKKAKKKAAKKRKQQRSGLGNASKAMIGLLVLSIIGIVVYVVVNRLNAPKPTPVADEASPAEVEEKLVGDDTFSDVEPDEVKVEHAENGDSDHADAAAEGATEAAVEETLAGDDTFSDVEPEEVKVEHADSTDNDDTNR